MLQSSSARITQNKLNNVKEVKLLTFPLNIGGGQTSPFTAAVNGFSADSEMPKRG